MSDCSTCSERQGHYLDAETIHAQQAHIDRLLDLNGKLCAEVNAQAVRIRELESLVRDMDYCLRGRMCCDDCAIRPCRIGERMRELGLEVDS